MIEKLKENIPPIHKEGFVFILISLAITLFFFMFSEVLGLLMSIVSVWCICFFRDPERILPDGENYIISPADGKVCAVIEDAEIPKEFGLKGSHTRVSIFLNVFNVHVNRIPLAGKVTKLKYHKGKFFNASLDKASEHNERQYVKVENSDKKLTLGVVQIAGLIARRIVCDLEEGQEVSTGDRFGIIRFGSRTDLYIPSDIAINVKVGQVMIGSESVIAYLDDKKVVAKAKPAAKKKANTAKKTVKVDGAKAK